ncbi:class II 3-deoxy-7-phosphoheptulonate synthase [Archangium sp.]|uniref:class II 3-deoxy-7-phosphoheptulonate synthase n=1 Tax=Archangium sp. TaxID=1872627 RepID=UPI00286B341E|nr:3-deoxy-7-phosphoheptulonate synthase class II [Archangium sp.]
MSTWNPTSWKTKPITQDVRYEDPKEVDDVVSSLGRLPPLVTSWEVERLRELLADAQEGRRFLLQGGDCAESLSDCRSDIITNRQKIILQMSLVLIHGGHRPVIRVGRIAGQYAKPRSKPTEVRNGVELPSYFGDLVNRPEFTPEARRADPKLMLACYHHAAMTLNFVRSLSDGGFADVHHPEYWDLSFFRNAAVPPELREEYEQATRKLSEALRFMEALGERTVTDLTRVDFYTSHEGLNLHYESAQTRQVPWRKGWYDLTTHLPWIGERTRALDGAHVEFFRGIRNPVGVKLGPSVSPDDAVRLAEQLNPDDERGKLVFITRMGAQRVGDALPPLVEAMRRAGRRVLWVCDPMHGNTVSTSSGIKTRSFQDVLREVEVSFDVHERLGSNMGGVHFELTGEDVTECVGGAVGITEQDLERNYSTLCDPRLNYRQALEMSFHLARRMSRLPRAPRP